MKFGSWVVLVNSVFIFLLVVGFVSGTLKFNFPLHSKSSNYNISFSPDVLDTLNKNFGSGVEHLVCLDGSFVSYHNVSFSRVVADQSGLRDSLSGYSCGGTLGSLHNHPLNYGLFSVCRPSVADVNGWKLEASKGTSFFIIQCGIDKFVYYTLEDLYYGVVYDAK